MLSKRSEKANRISVNRHNETINVTEYFRLIKKYKSDSKVEVGFAFPTDQENALNVIGFENIYKGYKRDALTQIKNLVAGKKQATDSLKQLEKKISEYQIGYNVPLNYWTASETSKQNPEEVIGNKLAEMKTVEEKLAYLEELEKLAKSN